MSISFHFYLPRHNRKTIVGLLIPAFFVLALCHQSYAEGIDFDRDIAPLLKEHCWDCHSGKDPDSKLNLDRRVGALRGGDYGQPAIVPGKPEKSFMIDVINHRDPELKMPPDEKKLPQKTIALLTRWVKEGADWPGKMKDVVEKKSGHWSFQPVTRPEVPFISGKKNLNPIDAFLLRKLHDKKLGYSKPADARSQIRRVSFVLTGLAPTPEATEAFIKSYANEPDVAYEKLVKRLLDSPHFGERWAQHWLDVIRWAETNGSESNMYRKNAWIYRDYVIRSFNEDKSYDQFLFEQIAGDTVGAGEAIGYLVAGPHVPVATVGQEPSARRQARADRMDEILQTVGASAMGMTIGCARCHNHKFDPISIRDYYAMSAVFQDIEFGSRFPELAEDHPRRVRGQELYRLIDKHRKILSETGPWEENWTGYRELHFPSVTTQSVRISFQSAYARIDELEIFGPLERDENLALASMGTKVDSPEEMKVPRSGLHKINDGEYGTEAWAGKSSKGSKEKPWVQFTFKKLHKINRIKISTNRLENMQTDYLTGMNRFSFGPYKVEVLDDDGQWNQVASIGQIKKLDHKHKSRIATLKKLNELVEQLSEEGPRPSFVAQLIRPVKSHVFYRGSPETPRDEVFAAGLAELNGKLPLKPDASGKERRVAFAKWLTSPDHPLTARVEANRLWHHIFGKGIVTTTSDFGAAGALPSHPELLDWLAAEFKTPSINQSERKQQSWSMKYLIRLMVTSQAFRQSSFPRIECLAEDADSVLLWRFPTRRMAAEVIRDSILQSSGSLDASIGGRSFRIHNVKKRYAQWFVTDNYGPHTWRRMIYQERMRRVDDQMFTAFDFPDCGQIRPKRPISTTPLQALNLMNSEFVIDQSKRIADLANQDSNGDQSAAVKRCFELLLARKPNEGELKSSLNLAQVHSLDIVCRAIINSNEFAFLP